MTTTSGPFIIGLIIILMIIHAIAVTLYLRNKRLTPSSVLVAPLSACIMPMLFVLFVIGPINQFGEAHYDYSKPKTIFTAKSNDHLILEYTNGFGNYRINETDVLRPKDYTYMESVTATVITSNSKKKYEFDNVKANRVKGNTKITKASITHVTKTQKCLFITIKDEYNYIQFDVTPTKKIATTE